MGQASISDLLLRPGHEAEKAALQTSWKAAPAAERHAALQWAWDLRKQAMRPLGMAETPEGKLRAIASAYAELRGRSFALDSQLHVEWRRGNFEAHEIQLRRGILALLLAAVEAQIPESHRDRLDDALLQTKK